MELQLRKILSNLNRIEISSDNLHLIAISNLQDNERRMIRWWCNKYKTPVKPLMDHTMEELIIEMLEDYYDKNPKEIERFMMAMNGTDDSWDGSVSPEYEAQMQKRLKKIKKIDLTKFQSDNDMSLSEEEEAKIIANLGKNLPAKKVVKRTEEGVKVIGEETFEDDFGKLE